MQQHTDTRRPTALESPILALQTVEEFAARRLTHGEPPIGVAPGVLAVLRDNHRTNARQLGRMVPRHEMEPGQGGPLLQAVHELLLRARAAAELETIAAADLERLEGSIVRVYEVLTAPELDPLGFDERAKLRGGNYIRAAQNLRLTRVALRPAIGGSRPPTQAQDARPVGHGSFPASDPPSSTGTHA